MVTQDEDPGPPVARPCLGILLGMVLGFFVGFPTGSGGFWPWSNPGKGFA
jgi:hypothetical protein